MNPPPCRYSTAPGPEAGPAVTRSARRAPSHSLSTRAPAGIGWPTENAFSSTRCTGQGTRGWNVVRKKGCSRAFATVGGRFTGALPGGARSGADGT